MQVKQ